MNLNFNISEFCITDDPIEQNIANMILKWHILEIQKVRDYLDRPVLVSRNSGYRPYQYELIKGRSGNSQHTFKEIHNHGVGAADYTLTFKGNKEEELQELFEAIRDYTNYKRIAIYPDKFFIHCDYASNQRQLFKAQPNWQRI